MEITTILITLLLLGFVLVNYANNKNAERMGTVLVLIGLVGLIIRLLVLIV